MPVKFRTTFAAVTASRLFTDLPRPLTILRNRKTDELVLRSKDLCLSFNAIFADLVGTSGKRDPARLLSLIGDKKTKIQDCPRSPLNEETALSVFDAFPNLSSDPVTLPPEGWGFTPYKPLRGQFVRAFRKLGDRHILQASKEARPHLLAAADRVKATVRAASLAGKDAKLWYYWGGSVGGDPLEWLRDADPRIFIRRRPTRGGRVSLSFFVTMCGTLYDATLPFCVALFGGKHSAARPWEGTGIVLDRGDGMELFLDLPGIGGTEILRIRESFAEVLGRRTLSPAMRQMMIDNGTPPKGSRLPPIHWVADESAKGLLIPSRDPRGVVRARSEKQTLIEKKGRER